MPVPFIPLAILGTIALFAASSDKKGGGGAEASSSSSPSFTPSAFDTLFEIRNGIQYWRSVVADALLGQWQTQRAVETGRPASIPMGTALALRALWDGVPAGAAPPDSAERIARAAAASGAVVLANLACSLPDSAGRMMALVAYTELADARQGSEWAVLLLPPGLQPPGGSTGPIPGIPSAPSVPGVPSIPSTPSGGTSQQPSGGTSQQPSGGASPIPGIPSIPSLPSIPGMPSIPGVPTPSGGTTPTTTAPSAPSGPQDAFSRSVDEACRTSTSPEALEEMADMMDAQGRPELAQKLRARAKELRGEQQARDMARGYSTHTIRPGDLASTLAQWYTGDGRRFREIPPVNPGPPQMKVVHKGGTTQLEPWQGTIRLPLAWKTWEKGLPPVAKGNAPSSPSSPSSPSGGSSPTETTTDTAPWVPSIPTTLPGIPDWVPIPGSDPNAST